jgi:hypothetical protein
VGKRVSALESAFSSFRFTGDLRLRGDSIFQDPPGFQNRNRARVLFSDLIYTF